MELVTLKVDCRWLLHNCRWDHELCFRN